MSITDHLSHSKFRKCRVTLILSMLFAFAGCNDSERTNTVELPPMSAPLEYEVTNLVGSATLELGGTVTAIEALESSYKAGILFAEFFDSNGKSRGSGDLSFSTIYKCGFKYLAAGPRPEKFSCKIKIPESAVSAKIRMAVFIKGWRVSISNFTHKTFPPQSSVDNAAKGFQMQIVSLWFLLFVCVVFVIYFCLPWVQPYVLLVASCVFYAFFGWMSFVFIGASALSIWAGGMAIERSQTHKEWILGFVVAFNVVILVLLKYIHPWTSIVVPLGISFYSLQAISYVWDVKRGTIAAERNPLKLMLYLIFFPTVMQGPISRYSQLGPQLWARHSYSWDRMQSGLELALWGFFKKMVIADRAAMLADAVFAPGVTIEGFPVLLGVLCYAIQIYADFSGCVDICRGISEVMGIDLIENFKHPYFATSVKDFWRRWHIALSSWLKDYVYIPLGGNRHGVFRKYLNVLIVFGVSGVWHGVGINFFIWGLLHGIYQVLDALTGGMRKRIVAFCRLGETAFSFRFGQRIWTFLLVAFAWIFFRAPTLADAWSVIKRMCVFNPWTWTDGTYLKHGLDAKDLDVLIFSLVVLVVVSIMQERFKVREWLARQLLWFRWSVYILAFFATVILGVYGPGYNASAFIYMQF